MRDPRPDEPTFSTTLETQVAAAQRVPQTTRMSLVFRWNEGRELVDIDVARALSVGRASGCDVRIDDQSLSRQHARFVREGDSLRVEDLGSRNGVSLRGVRVKSTALQSGDSISFGHVTASVHIFAPELHASPANAAGDSSWSDLRMAEVRRVITKIASTPLPVLVLGETGSGKELVAQAIHAASERADGPMRAVNCAAIPATLIESTLFGHERGAFTSADKAQAGVFEQAQGGTVFLDEIGELSLPAQAALLRVLETGRFTRVGGSREIVADVRIVAATHRDLHAMVSAGRFRLDLLHRLDAVDVHVPPLRERQDAIEPLAKQFLARVQRAWAKNDKRIDPAAIALLRAYAWPGNVRELRNAIERAVAISDSDSIGIADLPDRVRGVVAPAAPSGSSPTLPPPVPTAAVSGSTLKDKHAREERELIARTLAQTTGDVPQAATVLGLSLRTLQRRIQHYGLGKPRR